MPEQLNRRISILYLACSAPRPRPMLIGRYHALADDSVTLPPARCRPMRTNPLRSMFPKAQQSADTVQGLIDTKISTSQGVRRIPLT